MKTSLPRSLARRPGTALQHAAAAFVASRTATRQKCQEAEADFTWDVTDPQLALGIALTALNAELHPADKVAADNAAVLRQQHLSQALDRLAHEAHCNALSPADRVDLLSEMLPGASTFLEAALCKATGQVWEPLEFTTELHRRLLVPCLRRRAGRQGSTRSCLLCRR